VVLLLLVTSRVLSPQYMIWMLGLAAVVLSSGRSRLRRPAWTVVAAAVLTTSAYGPMGAYGTTYAIYGSPFIMLIRNLALLAATVDATVAMVRLLRERRENAEPLVEPAAAQTG